MGREAECLIRWGSQAVQAKVLLEGQELILRGAIKRRIPLPTLQALSTQKDQLTFTVDGEPVSLELGVETSQAWLQAIQTPPPTLAKKLGIRPASRVLAWGQIDSTELASALSVATGEVVSLVLIRASTPLELEQGLGSCWQAIETCLPVWIVYPRGKTSPLGEAAVRDKLRALGLIDTKVASISETLTGLRFVRR